ncbi:hypothetical protein L209DRAFT_776297 [Thermothelomyces heterothallicus CBS 203.75]
MPRSIGPRATVGAATTSGAERQALCGLRKCGGGLTKCLLTPIAHGKVASFFTPYQKLPLGDAPLRSDIGSPELWLDNSKEWKERPHNSVSLGNLRDIPGSKAGSYYRGRCRNAASRPRTGTKDQARTLEGPADPLAEVDPIGVRSPLTPPARRVQG